MQKLENKFLEETFYEVTLENGLQVFVVSKPDFNSNSVAIGVPYGALDYKQIIGEEVVEFAPGIAHFLEHKMFEIKGGDLLDEFSKQGANVNAFTSFNETVYYFQTTNSLPPLFKLLFELVFKLNISEESVEKEKKIIAEELRMYAIQPDYKLYYETFKAMYQNIPLNKDIGGSVEDIMKITHDDLQKCFRLNYHPSRLKLVITTNEKVEVIIKSLKEAISKYSFLPALDIERFPYQEPENVVLKHNNLEMDVVKKKLSLGFKMTPIKKEQLLSFHALDIWLESKFSAINTEYQSWLDQGLINDYFDYSLSFYDDYLSIVFFFEDVSSEVAQNLIIPILNKKELLESDFKQLQNSHLTSEIINFNSILNISLSLTRNLLQGYTTFDLIEALRSLDFIKAQSLIQDLDFSNFSITEINPKE